MQEVYNIEVPAQTTTFTLSSSPWDRSTLETLLAPHLPEKEQRQVEWYHDFHRLWSLETPDAPEQRQVEWYGECRSRFGPQHFTSFRGFLWNMAPSLVWPTLVVCDTPNRAREIQAVLGEHSASPLQASAPLSGFRERFIERVQTEGKHVDQSPGAESFGHVVLTIEPDATLEKVVFENRLVEECTPGDFFPEIASALREAVFRGGPKGYPLCDFRAALIGGEMQGVDDNHRGFRSATLLAVRNAFRLSEMSLVARE
jgi:hypothetical protein